MASGEHVKKRIWIHTLRKAKEKNEWERWDFSVRIEKIDSNKNYYHFSWFYLVYPTPPPPFVALEEKVCMFSCSAGGVAVIDLGGVGVLVVPLLLRVSR